MSQNALVEVVRQNDLRPTMEKALRDARVYSVDALRSDDNVVRLADVSFELMPTVFRAAIYATIGQEGWKNFVFRMRDRLLEMDTIDVYALSTEQLIAAFRGLRVAPVPVQFDAMRWSFAPVGRDGQVSHYLFDFIGPSLATAGRGFAEVLVVGRDEAVCHVVLAEQSVSRRHAEFRYDARQGLLVRDLGSANGTFLNNIRVDRNYARIMDRVMVQFGDLVLQVYTSNG